MVGEISDEYDHETNDVVELGDGRFRVNARLGIPELGELFGMELDDDEVDTVGGLFVKAFGRLPVQGDRVEVAGLEMQADEVIGRRRLQRVGVWASDAARDAQRAFAEGEQ